TTTTTSTQSPPTTTTTPTQSPPTTTTTPTRFRVITPLRLIGSYLDIAGFEWGCLTDVGWPIQYPVTLLSNSLYQGSCTYPNSPPLTSTADGPGQMKWFVSNGMNTFRLSIGWQYVTPTLGGAFDPSEWATYDKLVRSCLALEAYCIIDIHNYARWNGQVIGQSAVPDAPFIKLWQMIASYYASEPRVIFGLMNEPYKLDILTWAQTLQKVVTAVRAIAPKHVILLPGIEWAHADTFISSGSAAALDAISNPDGSKTNLIFDLHQWLDKPNNGTDPYCVTDNVPVFAPLAQWLRCHNRQAFLSATGGGNEDWTNCNPLLCQQMAFLLANSDVFVGYTGWAAGSYDTTYILDETPTWLGYPWVDTPLVASCLYWP
ncbi:glycoside hydrolase family 5 protein, partial [Tulasnella calospora MUT 4182]